MTAAELDRVKGLVADEMADGAMGIGSALIYPPGFYASTEELIELASVAGRYGGKYFSHLRSEGDRWEEAIDELLRISREGECAAEVWHLKAAGAAQLAEDGPGARHARGGARRRASRSPPTSTRTPRAARRSPHACHRRTPPAAPTRSAPGWASRPTRAAIASAIATELDAGWENLYLASGGADGVLLVRAEAIDAGRRGGGRRGGGDHRRQFGGVRRVGRARSRSTPRSTCWSGSTSAACTSSSTRPTSPRRSARPWISVGSDSASQADESPQRRAPAHVRHVRPVPRALLPRPRPGAARAGHPPHDRIAGVDVGTRPAGPIARGLVCRRGGVRPRRPTSTPRPTRKASATRSACTTCSSTAPTPCGTGGTQARLRDGRSSDRGASGYFLCKTHGALGWISQLECEEGRRHGRRVRQRGSVASACGRRFHILRGSRHRTGVRNT